MTSDTPDTPDPNKPPEEQKPATPAPIQPPSQRLPAFFQIPVDPAAVTPTTAPQHIPGIMNHPDLANMVEISAHAGIVQVLIRPSGAWMRIPCEWVPALVTHIEAAKDAAALMKSAIDMGTTKIGKPS